MMSEGIVEVDEVCEDVSERLSFSSDGEMTSAGIFSDAAVVGFTSCSMDGLY